MDTAKAASDSVSPAVGDPGCPDWRPARLSIRSGMVTLVSGPLGMLFRSANARLAVTKRFKYGIWCWVWSPVASPWGAVTTLIPHFL